MFKLFINNVQIGSYSNMTDLFRSALTSVKREFYDLKKVGNKFFVRTW